LIEKWPKRKKRNTRAGGIWTQKIVGRTGEEGGMGEGKRRGEERQGGRIVEEMKTRWTECRITTQGGEKRKKVQKIGKKNYTLGENGTNQSEKQRFESGRKYKRRARSNVQSGTTKGS